LTTTSVRGRASSNGSRAETVGIEPAKRRQRSLPLVLIAAICMIVSIVAFVGLQLASTDRRPVLAVARPIEAGAVITDADLRVAEVAADPALSPLPLSAKASVIGRTAAVDLRPGTLLVDSSLGGSTVVGDGEVLVGIEVAAAAAPVGSIRPGDHVRLLDVPKAADGKAVTAGTVITEGRVLRVGSTGSSTSAMSQLALVVPAEAGPGVASASIGQRIALVVVP
jgi:Flp pilus assembly protein CpaB